MISPVHYVTRVATTLRIINMYHVYEAPFESPDKNETVQDHEFDNPGNLWHWCRYWMERVLQCNDHYLPAD